MKITYLENTINLHDYSLEQSQSEEITLWDNEIIIINTLSESNNPQFIQWHHTRLEVV